jgi:hypothetical protein
VDGREKRVNVSPAFVTGAFERPNEALAVNKKQ